jgi:hypothetical protein
MIQDYPLDEEKKDLDLLWGAEAIAKFVGRTRRQTFGMLEARELPAKKVGGRWVASRKVLREFFEGTSQEAERRAVVQRGNGETR